MLLQFSICFIRRPQLPRDEENSMNWHPMVSILSKGGNIENGLMFHSVS